MEKPLNEPVSDFVVWFDIVPYLSPFCRELAGDPSFVSTGFHM